MSEEKRALRSTLDSNIRRIEALEAEKRTLKSTLDSNIRHCDGLEAENARLRRALDVMTRDLLETKSRLGAVGALKTERDLWRNETWKHDGIVSELEAENKRLKEQLVYMAKLYADETAQDSKPIVRDLLGHDWDG